MENLKECPICFNSFCQSLEDDSLVHGCCFDESNREESNREESNREESNREESNREESNREDIKNIKINLHDPELYCKKCNIEICVMLVPCQHIFCGSCIHKDYLLHLKDKKKPKYICSLCRTETDGFINIIVNPITYQKNFKISNTKVPIEIILNKNLLTNFSEKLMPKIQKDKFISMLGEAFKPKY